MSSSFSMMAIVALLLFMVSSVSALPARPTVSDILSSLPRSRSAHFQRVLNSRGVPAQHRPRTHTAVASTAAQTSTFPPPPVKEPAPLVFYPLAYGADPSGQADSTAAFQRLFADMLSPNATHTQRMADGFVDLGGATVDLQGGDYTVSRPLQIPPCYGNARIVGGSIRASKSFPSNKYIIIIGNDTTARPAAYPSYSALSRFASPDPPSCKNDGQGVYMQDVQLLGLLLDGQHVAAGGVLISYIMGALIGAQSYFVGFPKAGITVIAGHEVVIDAVWVAEYYWDSPLYDSSTSTGIEIFGNDHIIQNAIVFSANIGVHIIGAANLVYGAHTWNKGDESGGVGIFMDCAGYTQNRVIASYLDGNHLIAVSPEHLVVNECFFLGSAAVVLQSTANAGNNAINGLTILSNEWDGGDSSGRGVVIVDESRGAFTSLTDTFIDQNEIGGGYGTASTSARLHVSGSFSPGVPACWNLSQQLLFPQFPPAHVQATFSLSQRQEVAASDDGISWWLSQVGAGKGQDQRVVCIQVSMGGSSLDGEFYLEVDQSTRTGQDAQRIPYSAPAARTEREGQQEARKVSQPVRWF